MRREWVWPPAARRHVGKGAGGGWGGDQVTGDVAASGEIFDVLRLRAAHTIIAVAEDDHGAAAFDSLELQEAENHRVIQGGTAL